MSDQGMFDIPEPEWLSVPVVDLVTSLYRGQTVDLDGHFEVRFTGTHHGADADGPYIVVHGTDSNGFTKQWVYRPGQTIRVKAKS